MSILNARLPESGDCQGSCPRNGKARAAGFEEVLIEQNQTKALSCPAVLLPSDQRTTHANGKRSAFFLLERAD